MFTRRELFAGSAGILVASGAARSLSAQDAVKASSPVVITTWTFAPKANEAAWKILSKGGSALDAVEAGINRIELDPAIESVGYGGTPNEEGETTLDSMIMWGPKHEVGAVGCLKRVKKAISVARKVMETTRHVLLVGPGAQQFALEQGFEKTNLLTDAAKAAWEKWKGGPPEGHDTIGMCGLDGQGRLAVACTTSGLSWKLPGRVGDSPIVGAGAFVDQEVGAASATGVGEEVLQTCGTFLVVENMHRGMTPTQACEHAVRRILRKHPQAAALQVAYIALRADGAVGAFSIRKGFQYAHFDGKTNRLLPGAFAVSA